MDDAEMDRAMAAEAERIHQRHLAKERRIAKAKAEAEAKYEEEMRIDRQRIASELSAMAAAEDASRAYEVAKQRAIEEARRRAFAAGVRRLREHYPNRAPCVITRGEKSTLSKISPPYVLLLLKLRCHSNHWRRALLPATNYY